MSAHTTFIFTKLADCGELEGDSFGKRALRKVLAHQSNLLGLNLTIPEESPCCVHGTEPRKYQNVISSDLFFMLEPVRAGAVADDYSVLYGEGLCKAKRFRDHYYW